MMRYLSPNTLSAVVVFFGFAVHSAAWTETNVPSDTDSTCCQQHMVAVAHLDTQWRWTVRDSIYPYLGNTLRDNFVLFEKYPDYIFNFEGAFRYMMMKEYYPEEFEQLRTYIQEGRWHVAGAALDAIDVVMPSPESVIRSILYSQKFYREEFGITALDLFLPDCFGFSFTMPTIAAHCGIKGFSTQKLGWGSAAGIPFSLGVWEGIDGSLLPSVLHGGPYNAQVRENLSQRMTWINALNDQFNRSGFGIAYRYFGAGDKGGAPDESSVAWIEGALQSDGPLRVRFATSSAIFDAIKPDHLQKLPHYRGELLMTRHGVGGYTSLGVIKRLSRQNEVMSDAAEKASVAAMSLTQMPYPADYLRNAWIRFGWHHQHDGITGTSIPEANNIMLNDQIASQIQFDDAITEAVAWWSSRMDTRGPGQPIIIFNPLARDREELVDIAWPLDLSQENIIVRGPDGDNVPTQRVEYPGKAPRLLFRAKVPSVGLAVYHAVPTSEQIAYPPFQVSATSNGLVNALCQVSLNQEGQISSIMDNQTGREWLSHPIQWQFLRNNPAQWPAWEIEYNDIMSAPEAVLSHPSQIRILESGPLRSAVQVQYQHADTRITQNIFLEESNGKPLVTVDAQINWRTYSNLLKVAFPLNIAKAAAVYDLGIGSIERGVNSPALYEVPAQQWAYLGEQEESFGIAILNDSKYGWDRPESNTLRLSLIHSPGDAITDFGQHRVRYALLAVEASRSVEAYQASENFNMPMLAFATESHEGSWSGAVSFVQINSPGVKLLSLKKEENGSRLVVRLAEMEGQHQKDLRVQFLLPIVSAREINGLEEDRGSAITDDEILQVQLSPFQIKAWAIELAATDQNVPLGTNRIITLPFDSDMIHSAGEKHPPLHPARFRFPESLFPTTILSGNVQFDLSPKYSGASNAVRSSGQSIHLPEMDIDRVDVLAASLSGDRTCTWLVGTNRVVGKVNDMFEPVGQWTPFDVTSSNRMERSSMTIKNGSIAWISSHLIDSEGEVKPYQYGYLYHLRFLVYPGAKTLTFPDDTNILIFAVSAVKRPVAECIPLSQLREQAGDSGQSVQDQDRVKARSIIRGFRGKALVVSVVIGFLTWFVIYRLPKAKTCSEK